MDLGQKVRERRKAFGLSQEHLAHRAGVSLNAVHKLEAGRITDPHFSTLSGIARALDTTVAELVGEEVAVPLADASEAGRVGGEERPESWRNTAEEAKILRETGKQRMEEPLLAWAQGAERGEPSDMLRGPQDEVIRLMDEVYNADVKLQWAFAHAMMQEGGPDGRWARYLRAEGQKTAQFYDELIDLIKKAGIRVKQRGKEEEVEETEELAPPEVLELVLR